MSEVTQKVLFVDDEERSRKYFRLAFDTDFEILLAANADEALLIIEKHRNNLAILVSDQRMPGKTGVELFDLARIKSPDTIRILTTAYADHEDAVEAVNSGEIYRYINKPWEIESLRTELKKAAEVYTLRKGNRELLDEKLSITRLSKQTERVRDFIVLFLQLSNNENLENSCYQFLSDKYLRLLLFKDIGSNYDFESSTRKWLEIAKSYTSMLSALPFREHTDKQAVYLWFLHNQGVEDTEYFLFELEGESDLTGRWIAICMLAGLLGHKFWTEKRSEDIVLLVSKTESYVSKRPENWLDDLSHYTNT